MRIQKRHVLVSLALAAGIVLWFFFLTDYTFAGTLVDFLFPPVSLCAGLIGFLAARRFPGQPAKRLARLASLPALLGGLLYLALGALLAAFSPMGVMFAVSEIMGEQVLQAAPSPDGTRVAEVYFRGVGPYSGGNGRVIVRVKHPLLPFVERDVFYLSDSYEAGRNTTEYLQWLDNDTICIPETGEIVKLGLVKAKVPEIAMVPVRIFQYMSLMEAKRAKEKVLTAPLQDLPLYPGPVTADNSGADTTTGNGYRAFSVAASGSDEAASWYKQELSRPPWKIVSSGRSLREAHYGAELKLAHRVYNCLETERDAGNGHLTKYHWQIFSDEMMSDVRVIVETPNRPGVWWCDEP
jgi:hypothetical protein